MRTHWKQVPPLPEPTRGQQARSRTHLGSKIFLLILLALWQAACSSPVGTPGQTPTVSAPSTPTASSTPLPPREEVSFTTPDHLKLAAWLWDGGGSTALICSHESRGDKSNWADAAPRLAVHGYKVLAFDFRGFGDSQGPLDRGRLDQDMLTAISFMRSHGARKIILLGASLGGIVSLMVAARARVDGVITLSGGYYLDQAPPTLTVQEVRAITVPKLIIASQGDPYVGESIMVYHDANEPKELHLYPGSAHGTLIFEGSNGPDLYARIIAFVQKTTS